MSRKSNPAPLCPVGAEMSPPIALLQVRGTLEQFHRTSAFNAPHLCPVGMISLGAKLAGAETKTWT